MSCIHNYIFAYIYKTNIYEFDKLIIHNKYNFFDYIKYDDKAYITEWTHESIKKPDIEKLKLITINDINEMHNYVNNFNNKLILSN